ncbi:hypothetical protein [Paenibacillus sp. TH7-28]
MSRKRMVSSIASGILSFVLCIPLVAADDFAASRNPADNVEASINVQQEVSDMQMSDVLTFDELVSTYANDSGISVEQARETLLSNFYSGKRTKTATISPQLATYRTFTAQLNAMKSYKPSLKFYCETTEGGYSFYGILKVLSTTMNRVYQGVSKQYAGTVYTNLEHANRIHYIVSGDFYDNGTTTISGGGTAGIGESFELSFSVSYSSNWYATIYEEDDYDWD